MTTYITPHVGDTPSSPPILNRRASSHFVTPQQPGRHLVSRKKEKSEPMQIEVPCLTCHQRESQTVNTDVRITTMDIIDYENMDWKNKKGQTTQIAIYPTSSTPDEEFDYRITSAAMTESAQFSRYPGYTRHIIILDQPISPIHPMVHEDVPEKVDHKPKITLHHDKRKQKPRTPHSDNENESDDDDKIDFFKDWHLDEKQVDKESDDYAIHHLLPFKKHRFHGDWITHCHLTSASNTTQHIGFHVSDFNVFTNDKVCFAICDVIHLKAGGSESFVLQHETIKKHHHYIYVAETHVTVDLLAVDQSQQLHEFWRHSPTVTPYTLVLQQGQTLKIDSLRHKHKDGDHPNIGVHLSAPRDHTTHVIVISIEFVDGQ